MTMRNRVLMVFIGMFLGACGRKQDLIPPDKMAKILMDVNLAENYSMNAKDSLNKGNMKNADSLAVYYAEIFEHYHVTDSEFSVTLDWYKAHPELIDSTYSKLIMRIASMNNPPVRRHI
jgi:Domain of unknown function (DUF4296)